MSALATLGLVAGTAIAVAGPAAAAAVACSAGMTAQSGLTVEPLHATTFYADLGKSFDAAYVGYRVHNSGSARSDVWVQVGSFTGGSVSLADATDDRQQIASLPAGGQDTAFFLVKTTAENVTNQAHTVTVYDRRPDLSGATSLATCSFTFAAVTNAQQASANKVDGMSVSTLTPAIGQTVDVTVDGSTGTVAGPIWLSPAAYSSWPSKALRLEGVTVLVDATGDGTFESTLTDTLYLTDTAAFSSQGKYRATYRFRLTRPTATNPTVMPVAEIQSGQLFKHSPAYASAPTLTTSSAASAIAVSKTMTAADASTLPTTTSPNGVSGATTYVEVPFRVQAALTSGTTGVVDEVVDVPASGVIFKHGSGRLTDALQTGATLPDPVTSSSDPATRAGALHFTGPFYASQSTAVTVTYTMYVPVTAGTYTNQAFATINGTTIGSSPSTVPIVSVTTNGSGVSGTTTGTTGAGVQSQTISFTQPAAMVLPSSTQSLTASATSGLAVTITSSTPSVCTVSGTTVTSVAEGTCTLTATQAGDASYAAATPVTRSFTVSKGTQTITFAQPADMLTTSSPATLTATSSASLPVTITSTTTSVCTVSGTTVTPVGEGTCSLTATQAGTASYAAATPVTRTFAVTRASQTLTFAPPADALMVDGTVTVSASSSVGLPVTITSSTPDVCTVEGTTVTLVSAGTCSLTASQDGTGTYAPASSVTRTFTVSRSPQTISLEQPSRMTYGGLPQHLAVSATSGLPVTVASTDESVCTVSVLDGVATVTATGGGTCSLTATQAGDGSWLPASDVTASFSVVVPGSTPQTITFAQPADRTLATPSFTATATASSGLPVTLTSTTPSVCTVDGSTVTLLDEGTCTLVASQDGDETYHAATSVERSFAVTHVAQTITFAQPADRTMLMGPLTLTPSASSGLPVTLTSSTPEVCAVEGTTVTPLSAGTCTLTASQGGDAVYAAAPDVERSFAVSRVAQAITFVRHADVLMTASPVTITGSASSGLDVTFVSEDSGVCTVEGGVVTLVGAGDCRILALQGGDLVYEPATPVERTFTVSRAPQTITFAGPADGSVDAVPALTASSTSGLDVVLTSTTPGVCTVVDGVVVAIAAGDCTVRASQPGDATWLPASDVERTFHLDPATQTVTLTVASSVPLDRSPAALSVSATSGLPVTVVSSTPDVCTVEDGALVLHSVGACELTASQAGDGWWAAAPDVLATVEVKALSQTITFATPADRAVDAEPWALDATASSDLPVSYVSLTPGVCTVEAGVVTPVSYGDCTLRASQPGDASYAEAVDVDVTVHLAALTRTVSFTQPADAVVPDGWVALTTSVSTGGAAAVTSATPDVCTPYAGGAALHSAGICTLTASAPAEGWYLEAAAVEHSFVVRLADQTLDLAAIDDVVLGDPSPAYAVTSSRHAAVVPVSLTPDVCTVGDGVVLPVAEGTCTLRVSDDGDGAYVAVGPYDVSFAVLPALVVDAPELPTATPGDVIDVAVPASGGVGPYTFEVTDGSLPAGVVLDPETGALSGTVAQAGTYRFTVTVTDADGRTEARELVLVVEAAAPLLPALDDAETTMVAGTTTSHALPGIPLAAHWEVDAPDAFTAADVVDGALVLTASASRSGVHVVVVTAVLGAESSSATVTVSVVPQAPGAGTYALRAGLRSQLAWRPSPNPSVVAYRVYVGGRLVARTASTSVVLSTPLGPRSSVTVRAEGADVLVSSVRALRYRAPKAGAATIALDVHFSTASAALTPTARAQLRRTAVLVRSLGLTHLRLVGHTDDRGSYAYNLRLSQRRADAVRTYLQGRLPGVVLSTTARSEIAPIASNATSTGQAVNRRVELLLW